MKILDKQQSIELLSQPAKSLVGAIDGYSLTLSTADLLNAQTAKAICNFVRNSNEFNIAFTPIADESQTEILFYHPLNSKDFYINIKTQFCTLLTLSLPKYRTHDEINVDSFPLPLRIFVRAYKSSGEITVGDIEKLISLFKQDYARWMDNAEMQQKYNDSFGWTLGSKYIKLWRNKRVIAFIVNTHDDIAPYGAIMQPKSNDAPNRRLGERTNILSPNPDIISWLGLR